MLPIEHLFGDLLMYEGGLTVDVIHIMARTTLCLVKRPASLGYLNAPHYHI